MYSREDLISAAKTITKAVEENTTRAGMMSDMAAEAAATNLLTILHPNEVNGAAVALTYYGLKMIEIGDANRENGLPSKEVLHGGICVAIAGKLLEF